MRRRKTRTRRREACAAVAAALCLSGCGGAKHATPPQPPKLPRALASSLAATSDRVAASLAAGDSCTAAAAAHELQTRTIAAINAGRVPAALQEQLSSSVNALTARVTCVLPAPEEEEHGKHKGHGKKHGEGD